MPFDDMTFDDDDPILDACLEEVLAGRSPPDLSRQIVQSAEASGLARAGQTPSAGVNDELTPEAPPVLAGVVAAFDDEATQSAVAIRGPAVHLERRRETSSFVLVAAVAAAFVGLGITIGVMMLVNSKHQDVAERATKAPDDEPIVVVDPTARPESQPPKIATPREPNGALAVQPATPAPTNELSLPLRGEAPIATLPEPKPPAAVVVVTTPETRSKQRSPDVQIVSFVNAELSRTWSEVGIKASPAASDAQWCERLFATLLGRLPSAAELKSLADDKAANRREKLVDRLLTQAEFAEEYAQHWSSRLTNVFIGKRGVQPGSVASREDLQKYFYGALAANKPYDEMARDLLTASGSAKPGQDDYNPAVNFLLDGLNGDATFASARVARVLLGHQLQCAQCHEHPSQGWSQEQFWAFNSFFRQMRSERAEGVARLVNADFRARSGRSGGEVFYETPAGLMKTALPRFIDGTAIPASGELAVVDRRRELAKLVVRSDEFAKATVNRVWAQVFDYGFTRPIDDLGPKAAPIAPQSFDRLAAEFVAHDFDLKRLLRWSVLSDPFGRSSKLADLASKDMPEEGGLAYFSRDYSRPPAAAAVVGSLVQAVRIRNSAGSKTEVEKARIDWLTQANRSLAKKGGKLAAPPAGPSALMNTTSAIRSASGDPTGLVKQLTESSMPFEKKIEHVFLFAVGRQPTAREQRAAADLLRAAKDNQAAAVEDAWWAVVNSNECVIDR